ncbi:MAG: TPM domain-containing protein [Bacteroidia bacterium]|nr:TPM domain-containing protein [Bacteroidia bacterium]
MLDYQRIEKAITQAEMKTSGEIRVYVEEKCQGETLDRAAEVFEKLEMHKTALRNGVLFYLATKDKKFAILGDGGINTKVGKDFWNEIKSTMLEFLKNGDLNSSLETGINMAGDALSNYFPYDALTDKNELSNEIVKG